MDDTTTMTPIPNVSEDNVSVTYPRELLEHQREVYLAWVDWSERLLGTKPRTAQIRKWYRDRNK